MIDISLSYEDGEVIKKARALLQRYEIALFTVPGELSCEPEFGIGIEQWVSEPNNEKSAKALRQHIIAMTDTNFPYIKIISLAISKTALDTISIDLRVMVVPENVEATIQKDVTSNG